MLSSPRLSTQERIFFAQRLAFLLEGGVALLGALTLLSRQMRTAGGRRVLEAVRGDVAAGRALADAMAKHPRAFGAQTVRLVRLGESCGLLGRNLQLLAVELQKRQRLVQKVVGSLTYPAIVVVAALGIAGFLTTSLLPKLLPVFSGLRTPLPASTRAVLALSAFLRGYGWWVVAGVIGVGGAGAYVVRRFSLIRARGVAALLRVPIFGALFRHAHAARFSRSAHSLLMSGMTLRDACVSCASPEARSAYDRHFLAMADAVNRGSALSSYLHQHPLAFPELFSQMVAAGEDSGKLPEAFLYLAEHYEHEIDRTADQLSLMLEPALMLFTGSMVGFIALAVISPMYALTQSLHG